MTQEQSSTLTFSIEDSVWLNKGQQIDEILGMSLTPEIYVDQDGEHVTIKGGLRFIGEYKVEQADVEVEEQRVDPAESSFTQLSDFRQAGEIHLAKEEARGEIEHLFPIDITIPMARIQHVDDIYVEIASFDYDLPEKGCIQLTADVCISGMKSEGTEEQAIAEEVTRDEDYEEEETMETAFSFETYKQEGAEEQGEQVSYGEARTSQSIQQETYSAEQQETDRYEEEPVIDADKPMAKEEIQAIEEVVIEEEELFEEEELPTYYPHSSIAREESQSRQAEEKPPVHYQLSSIAREKQEVNQAEEQEEAAEPVSEKVVQKNSREENASYLTNMLRNEEEQFSKWKMCIIQEEDTLESIAERYELSASQLTRYNNLDTEKVEEGQILYIPVSAK